MYKLKLSFVDNAGYFVFLNDTFTATPFCKCMGNSQKQMMKWNNGIICQQLLWWEPQCLSRAVALASISINQHASGRYGL